MTIVQNTLTLPNGDAVVGGTVKIALVVNGFTSSGHVEILQVATVKTSRAGLWSVNLTPQSQITPANTYYTVTHPDGEVLDFYVTDAAGPLWLHDLLVVSPSAPGAVVHGIPAGGTTGQALEKASNGDYDVAWVTPGAGSVTSITAGDGTVTIGGTVANPTVKVTAGQFDAAGAAATALATAESYADTGDAARLLKSTRQSKTGNYTAVIGDLVAADTTGGTFTVTIPAAAGGKGRILVKWVAGTVPPTVALTGSDHINTATGDTSTVPSLLGQGYQFESDGTSIWTVTADDLPLSQLDLRYAGIARPNQLQRWRAGLGRVRGAAGDAKILCIGDSTAAGVGVTAALNGGNVTNQGSIYAWPYQLAALLNANVPAARGLGIPGANSGNADPRWTLGTGWGYQVGFAWGRSSDYQWTSNGSPANLVYTDPVLCDRYDVYWLRNASLGTVTFTATGGSAVPQATAGATAIGRTTVSAAAAATTNTLTMAPTASSGNVHIVGVEPWLSTQPRVRVGNAGVGTSSATGAGTGSWSAAGAVVGLGPLDAIKQYAPDLTIIILGINDAIGNVATATYIAGMQAIITACQISGDAIIVTPVPPQSSQGAPGTTNYPLYLTALRALGLPFNDLLSRWTSGDNANTVMGFYWNAIHPNERGYGDIAQMIAAELLK